MQRLLWILAVGVLAGLLVTPLIDPDLWWHIAVGKWILAHHSVPYVDYWNRFGAGKPWLAYSWLIEIIFAKADLWGGLHGLLSLKIGFTLLLAGTVAFVCSVFSGRYAFGLLVAAIAIAGCLQNFTLRPQVLSWVIFALLLLQSEMVVRYGLTTIRGLSFTALFALWANTNVTEIIGFVAVLAWIHQCSEQRLNRKQLLGVALFSLIGTLLTPYQFQKWVLIARTSSHPFRNPFIREFEPSTVYDTGAAITVFLLVILSVTLHYRPSAARRAQWITAGMLSLLAFTIMKFTPFAIIYIALLISYVWRGELQHMVSSDFERAVVNLENGILAYSRKYSLIVAASFIICIAYNVSAVWRRPLATHEVARDAVDFMQEHQLPGPLLNEFTDGGYLIYRYSDERGEPRELVALDGRTNVNDERVARDYITAMIGLEGWKKFIEDVEPKTALVRNRSALQPLLEEDPDWCELFRVPARPVENSGSKPIAQGWTVFLSRAEYQKIRGTLSYQDSKCN